uniref:Uncharacterized protein n=1 Tax=Tremella fuciformis TaxID=64657 RepID=D5KY03_9TREE|nr:unknown [Tremella fuciformis]
MEDIAVEDEPEAQDAEATAPRLGQERELAKAFAEVEDEEDVEAARVAQGEGELDFQEFTDTAKAKQPTKTPQDLDGEDAGTPAMAVEGADEEGEDEGEEDEVGGVDEYMLRLVEWDWEWFAQHY